MVTITVDDVQRDLRSCLRQVRKGISLVILEAEHPVAELKPFSETTDAAPAERHGERRTGVAGIAPGDPEVDQLEAEIDQLYDEIRDLVAGSAEEPAARARIEQKRERLRSLQQREAELMERRAAARLRFHPGRGEQLLERAGKLLER